MKLTSFRYLSCLAPCLVAIVVLEATASTSFAAKKTKETKGLLPEVILDENDESKNQDRALKSELLITKSENKAIESLQRIIEKKKGTPEEAGLLYRLAELYMRRAKSGRFFDLNTKKQQFVSNVDVRDATTYLNSAIKIYDNIIVKFPKYENLDAVHFNIAMASLQTRQAEKAKMHYTKITTDYTKSPIYPDALLELGEIYYNQHNFQAALDQFKKIEAFPKSKAYPYGTYKSAWCYYNMHQNDLAVNKLKEVVKNNPPGVEARRYNMRKEALRDLTLFVENNIPPEQLYSFFQKITTEDELGEVMINLATLYESHSLQKEVNVFLKEFIEKNELSPQTPKAYARLIDVNEALKQRETVLAYMEKLSEHCYEKDFSKDSTCKTEFKKISLDISKKWWDIWLKNKNHVEFSKLTEKAFEILLSKDDPSNPDSLSRFAYAELLFQMGKYDKASENYEIVSLDKKVDAAKKHDALYGAIYSMDKMIEKDKKQEDILADSQQKLTQRYITEFPKGEYLEPLKFKLGFLAYQKQNIEEALKYLLPLSTAAKDSKLKLKSEDIVLDIYNLKKDYKSIQSFAQKASTGTSEDRRKNLDQIQQEAHFSQMQIEMDKQDTTKKIDTLLAFSNQHKDSKLSKEALWQSISLAYANGFDVKGADLSLNYYEKFPQDEKNLSSLKEAAKAYSDAGYISQSIKTFALIAKLEPKNADFYAETNCGLLQVNNQVRDAQNCYMNLISKADKAKKEKILEKLADTLDKNQSLSSIPGVEALILRENIEPYVTESLIQKARKLLAEKKYSEAFQLSLKVNSRPVDSDIRADARLVQAEILEKEFMDQSVKASEAKFSLVLGMKTEKLDKAYTAYTSAIKMAKNVKIHDQALRGIDRLYTHFIEVLTTMPIPASLGKADQDALRAELVKMSTPFVAKKAENAEKISQISKNTSSVSGVIWATLSPEKTVLPQLNFPEAVKLTSYLPNDLKIVGNESARLPAGIGEKQCDPKKATAQSIGSCILAKKYSPAEALSLQLTSTKENRAVGLYYLSVIADLNRQHYKSLWFIEKALALDSDVSMFNYQKGKLIYAFDGIDAALPFFERSIDLKRSSKEITLINGLKSYSDKDFISASDELKRLSQEDQDKYNISVLLVESTAQKGNTEEALKLGEKFLSSNPKNVDMYLQLARIHEEFPVNVETSKKLALENYQKALSKSDNNEQKNWLKKKISFLSEAAK